MDTSGGFEAPTGEELADLARNADEGTIITIYSDMFGGWYHVIQPISADGNVSYGASPSSSIFRHFLAEHKLRIATPRFQNSVSKNDHKQFLDVIARQFSECITNTFLSNRPSDIGPEYWWTRSTWHKYGPAPAERETAPRGFPRPKTQDHGEEAPKSSSDNQSHQNPNTSNGIDLTGKLIDNVQTVFGGESVILDGVAFFREEISTQRLINQSIRSGTGSNVTRSTSSIRGITKGMGVDSAGLVVVDVVYDQEIRPSHVINGAMAGLAISGVGGVVTLVWFLADIGTGLITGNSISERIDEEYEQEFGGAIIEWGEEEEE